MTWTKTIDMRMEGVNKQMDTKYFTKFIKLNVRRRGQAGKRKRGIKNVSQGFGLSNLMDGTTYKHKKH